MIRLLIAGSRTFNDARVFNSVIGDVLGEIKEDVLIIEGGAKGADTLAGEYAKANGIELVEMKPEWSKYGRAAGIKRNENMVKYAAEENGVAVYFWDGKSKGTAHCIEYARKSGLQVMVFDFTGKRCA